MVMALQMFSAVIFGVLFAVMGHYAGAIVFSGYGVFLGLICFPIGLIYGFHWVNMKVFGKLLIGALLLCQIVFAASKITILNPAWVIGKKYPDAKRDLEKINTAGIYSLSSTAKVFGIPMTDPDHHLKIVLDGHPSPLRLDDFAKANLIHVKNSSVRDISAFLKPSSRLYEAYFIGCDFEDMPQEQRKLLKLLSDELPDWYYIPYEEKRKQNKSVEVR